MYLLSCKHVQDMYTVKSLYIQLYVEASKEGRDCIMQTEPTLHVKLSSADVGKYAIIPGSPERTAKIAALLDNPRKIMQNREHTSWEGFLEGEKVIVTSTGMGGPSTAICVEELAKCGIETFIRVGTCASTSTSVNAGDVVVPNATVRMEGTALHYVPIEFPTVPNYELLHLLVETSKKMDMPAKVGITITKDSFFTEIDPHSKPVAYQLVNAWESYVRGGAIATAMEEATLFAVTTSLGLRSASILVSATSLDIDPDHSAAAASYPAETEMKPIRIAVEALRTLILSEKT